MKKDSTPPWKCRERKPVTPREVTNYMGADVTVYESIDPSVTSEFVGYDHLSMGIRRDCSDNGDRDCGRSYLKESKEPSLFRRHRSMRPAEVRRRIQDMIRTAEGEFQVEDTMKLLGGKIGHVGIVTKGMIKIRR